MCPSKKTRIKEKSYYTVQKRTTPKPKLIEALGILHLKKKAKLLMKRYTDI